MSRNVFEEFMLVINAERCRNGWEILEVSNKHVKIAHPKGLPVLHFRIQEKWTKQLNEKKVLPFPICVISVGEKEDLYFCITPDEDRFLLSRLEFSSLKNKISCTKRVVTKPNLYEQVSCAEDNEKITLMEKAFLSLLTEMPSFRLLHATGELLIVER